MSLYSVGGKSPLLDILCLAKPDSYLLFDCKYNVYYVTILTVQLVYLFLFHCFVNKCSYAPDARQILQPPYHVDC